jgi:hypothetical protein
MGRPANALLGIVVITGIAGVEEGVSIRDFNGLRVSQIFHYESGRNKNPR